MRKSLRPLLAAAVFAGAALGSAAPAMAADPTGDYAQFKYCPYTNPAVVSCIVSKTTSGSFKLGNATVPIPASNPITLQGGIPDAASGSTAFYPAVGADTLSKTKLQVPGGLLGLVDTGGFGGALITLFNNAVASVNDVYATAEIVGAGSFNLNNVFAEDGIAVTLPLRVHLENPFLGSGCYIGSPSQPVLLKLTTGTTAPPGPNTPITGTAGAVSFNDAFTISTAAGIKLVDNAFAAPAASNCGNTFLDKLLVTPAVNLKEGLPAAAGKNAAIMQGETKLGSKDAVVASIP
ncbi:MAG TPA: hypothetical protein VK501_13965 [Baekduia sp.]|uniref:hypothetical protein n=1 Tax=Baekduia sp. TaxID=2600305 RepID=UPI002C1CEB30|nr:hypothetical protein [Baekduia sp.]HMJ35014.1 hypothetical protein [Baekduia sp.]